MAFIVAMAQPTQGQPSFLVQLLPVAMIGAIFYFIILLPVRRKQKKVEAVPGRFEGRRPRW